MSVGGIIVAVRTRSKSKSLLVKDKNDYTVVSAEKEHDFKIGDKIWWQAGYHYWTRPIDETKEQYEFVEKKIKKIGYSKCWSG